MIFGNWFCPICRRKFLDAAVTSLKTISRGGSLDSAPFVRMVRCRTVENTLSIGFVVSRCARYSAGKPQREPLKI